ncbi:sodium:solute symporter family transporter [Escherichia coli]
MAADSHHSIVHARRISMTWMILCLAGAVAVGFLGLLTLMSTQAVAGAVNQNAERVFIELAQILLTRGLPDSAVGNSGGGNVNVKLPAAGVLQCDYRRFIQSVSA